MSCSGCSALHQVNPIFFLFKKKIIWKYQGTFGNSRARELFLPENDFKTSSTLNFPKKHPHFGDLETNQIDKTQTRIFFISPSTYELNIM